MFAMFCLVFSELWFVTGSRTPHYGSQTPLHDGSRTPGQSGAWDPNNPNTPSRQEKNLCFISQFNTTLNTSIYPNFYVSFYADKMRIMSSAMMTSPPRLLRVMGARLILRPLAIQRYPLHRSIPNTILKPPGRQQCKTNFWTCISTWSDLFWP